ncbi:MAG: FkbM family methyltransferase [Woeseiaceae bacterium]
MRRKTPGVHSLNLYERLHMRHRRWRYARKSERPSIAFLQSLDIEGRALIDAGANWGVYSWIMSECAGPEGQVFSFEPQPELNEHLLALKSAFELNNMTVTGAGLSSAPGTLDLQRPKAGSGEAGVSLPAGTFDEVIEVPVTTIDLFLAATAHKPVGFIKADVQGHEYHVFKGGEQTIVEHRPVLLFELFDYEADSGEIFNLLSNLGYCGWFFNVNPEDHRKLSRNGRGVFIDHTEYGAHSNVREGVDFRNYFFAHKDSSEYSAIRALQGQLLTSAALS